MDGLQFTASVIQSLAWPVAVTGSLYMMRTHVREIFGRLKSFKGGGVELTIAERSEQAIEQLPIPAPDESASNKSLPIVPSISVSQYGSSNQTSEARKDTFEKDEQRPSETADSLGPSGRILTAWREIERDVAELCRSFSLPRTRNALTNAKRLYDNAAISESQLEALYRLKKVRDSVAHSHENANEADAVQFVASLVDLRKSLRSVKLPRNWDGFYLNVSQTEEPFIVAELRKHPDFSDIMDLPSPDRRVRLALILNRPRTQGSEEPIVIAKRFDSDAEEEPYSYSDQFSD